MIDRIIIPEAEIICRCENREMALRKEKYHTGHYYLLSKLKPDQYVLLSDRDSYFKLIRAENGTYTLKLRD